MIQYLGILDSISFLMFSLILYFLSVVSKRLGEAMGIGKFYYLYYIGMFFILSGSIIMALSFDILENTKLFAYVFFSIGLTIGFITAIKYWAWLIKDLFRG